ncbi:Uncharacterized protein pbN1_20890 [Aromatoleum bremense]|nr:Uncharacterized protein pbN1_20890 [Aromatoleum bremense]
MAWNHLPKKRRAEESCGRAPIKVHVECKSAGMPLSPRSSGDRVF